MKNFTNEKMAGQLAAPIFVWWDITQKCNFSCTHCYSHTANSPEGYTPRPDTNELSTKEATALIKELARLGVFYIYFLGGEPFIRPDFLDIVAYAQRNHIGVMINTNGWFITESIAKYIKQLGVRNVRVCLDGASAETHDKLHNTKGAFNHAVSAIRSLIAAGIPYVSAVTAITSHNFNEVGEIIDLVACLGVSDIQCVPISKSGRGLSAFEQMGLNPEENKIVQDTIKKNHALYKEKMVVYSVDGVYDSPFTQCIHKGLMEPDFMGCRPGRLACNINANGDINPCLLVREPIAGNIRQKSFGEIWQKSEVFAWWRTQRLAYPECNKCGWDKVCVRECPLSSNQTTITNQERKARVQEFKNVAAGRTCQTRGYNLPVGGSRL